MTGKELKIKLKEAAIRQEDAAHKLGITLRTLQNWFKYDLLDANMMANIKESLDIDIDYTPKAKRDEISTGKVVPYYDVEAAAGLDYGMNMEPAKQVGLIEIGGLLKDSESALRIYGNSMTPNYPAGCVVGLRRHYDSFIEPGNVYVVETRDNRYIKRLYYNRSKTAFRCVSDNSAKHDVGSMTGEYYYPDFEIPLEEVIAIHRVIGVIKRNVL